jgi:hypothetical protein
VAIKNNHSAMQKLIIGILILFFSLTSVGQTKINLTLKKELDSILFEDQNLRDLISSGLLQTKSDSLAAALKIDKKELIPYIIKQISISDSLNLIRVEQIIKQFGYPGLSLVGPETNEAAYYVIQHSTKIDKYIPLIKKAAYKKEIEFKLYAMMLDRSLMYKEKEQIYGTQGKFIEVVNNETQKKERKGIIWPIKDPSGVNSKRKIAGFKSTVEESAKQIMGIKYEVLTLENVRELQGIVANQKLKIFIDSLLTVDQVVQYNIVEASQRNVSSDSLKILFEIKEKTFARHIPILKAIFKNNGYPTFEKVGKESSNNFFILVQHADADVKFQEQMLPLIKMQVDKKQVKGSNYAYLYDRVQINNGKQQLYGTQLDYDNEGNAFSKNLKDKETVNARRSEFGMTPLEDYLAKATALHKKQNEKK